MLPPMMMLLAHGEGPLGSAIAERSILSPSRSLCLVSTDIVLLVSQRCQNLFAGRIPRRRHAANQSHDNRENDGIDNHRQRDSHAELNFAECYVVRRGSAHAVEGKHENDA